MWVLRNTMLTEKTQVQEATVHMILLLILFTEFKILQIGKSL